jgi:hypothetical protein
MNKGILNTRNHSSRKKDSSFFSSSNLKSFSCRSPGFSDRHSIIKEEETVEIKIPTPYPKNVIKQ